MTFGSRASSGEPWHTIPDFGCEKPSIRRVADPRDPNRRVDRDTVNIVWVHIVPPVIRVELVIELDLGAVDLYTFKARGLQHPHFERFRARKLVQVDLGQIGAL